MPKILSIDYGEKRVGTALADAELGVVTPYKTFARKEAEKSILDLIEKEQVATVVVGLPLNQDGERTKQCLPVETFYRRLERRSSASFITWNEGLSSFEAEQRFIPQGFSTKDTRRKGMIDSLAAAIILQDYLEQS